MDNFHFDVLPKFIGRNLLLSKLSRHNSQIFRERLLLYHPNPYELKFRNNQLITGIVGANDRVTVVKSFRSSPKMICGSNTGNIGLIHNISGRETIYSLLVYADHSDIYDIDISKDDSKFIIAQRSYIDVLDSAKQRTEAVFKVPFAIKCQFSPLKPSIVAAVAKDQLSLFDLRSTKTIGNFSSTPATDIPKVGPEAEIRRKPLPRQPRGTQYKPSDLAWASDTILAVSTRSSPYVQLYDVRYSKGPAATIGSLKQSREPLGSGSGIEHLISSGELLYGLSYSTNTITAHVPSTGMLMGETDILSGYAKGSSMTLMHDSLGFPALATISANKVKDDKEAHLHTLRLPTSASGFHDWDQHLKASVQAQTFSRFGQFQNICYNESQKWLAAAAIEDWRYELADNDHYDQKNVLIKFIDVCDTA